MFCKNCGKEVHKKAIACPGCGVSPGTEKNYCQNCGSKSQAFQVVCVKCGMSLVEKSETENGKSLIVAGILGIFPITGALGIHRFYLGYKGLGLTHIFLLVLSIFASFSFLGNPFLIGNSIWAIVEGTMIFTGTISKDASGRPFI